MTLGELYGPEHAYNPIAPDRGADWIRTDPSILGLGIARRLPIAGALPMLCPSGAASPRGLELLEGVGIRPPENLIVVDSPESKRAALDRLARTNTRIALQHAHPLDEIPESAWWIDPKLLSFLNNKANLTKLAPEGHTPRREVMSVAELSPEHPAIRRYPLFVKVATDLSTGGATAVRRCTTPAELAAVTREFADRGTVVVEDEFQFERSYCVQFAIPRDGKTQFLGAAEQICNEDAAYIGSWFDLRAELDPGFIEVGTAISDVASAMGYYGIAGYDMAQRADGRVIVFDLNFRINGSSTALLLSESIYATRGTPVMRSGRYRGSGSFEDLCEIALRACDEGWLVPYATVDPRYTTNPDGQPLLAPLLLGESREAVNARHAQLTAML